MAGERPPIILFYCPIKQLNKIWAHSEVDKSYNIVTEYQDVSSIKYCEYILLLFANSTYTYKDLTHAHFGKDSNPVRS